MVDSLTKDWIKNASDDRAVKNGCRFDMDRATHICEFFEEELVLYEGEFAGQPFRLMDWQKEFLMRCFGWVRFSKDWNREVRRFRKASLWVPKKNGKALSLDTVLPTPTGWTTIGEVAVGDTLFDKNGKQCKVRQVHPIWMQEDSYLVTFSNGQTVRCCGEHEWVTETLKKPKSKRSYANQWTGKTREYVGAIKQLSNGVKTGSYYAEDVYSTTEIIETLETSQGAKCHRFKLHGGLETDDKTLFLPPYFLGLWLGDGDSDCSRLTSSASDMEFYRGVLESYGYDVLHQKKLRYSIKNKSERRSDSLTAQLRKHGLKNNKHIPRDFLRASRLQRLELLQGLMDSDGCCSSDGKCLTFLGINQTLVNNVGELLSSLGVKYSLKEKTCRSQNGTEVQAYQIQFHAFREELPCFKLPRKLERMRSLEDLKMTSGRSSHVHIVSIEPIQPTMMRCITVDSESETFLFGETMLPTHNSPMAAGVGLYLLSADGEEGQKVYSVAKDGKQAKIVHTHAMEMVKRSPNLREACTINKSTGRILYQPTTSWYDLLSGDNIEGQEGLNGSSITDEKHVVTRRLAKVLEYMGASRAEPMDFGVSTYGNNPDSYGKQDCDYGKAVERGDIDDESFLHLSYELPEGMSFEEAGNPEVWSQCNPSYGITIKETEMAAAHKRASRSLVDQNNFLMYRTNKWNTSESPWLRYDDWNKNAESWKLENFYGDPVWLALDLSKTRDMSSMVLVFRKETEDEPIFYQFPYFWLPQTYAETNADKVDFLGWAKEGYLEITPGDTIKQAYIKDKMKFVDDNFEVMDLSYDKTYAFDLIDEYCEDVLKWNCIEFGQSLNTYAGPTENYEAMLVENRLKHNNHPVLNWQAGHVQVKTNSRNDKMPCKPKRDDIKKIDGIVAGVMALNLAYHHGVVYRAGQFYEEESNWIS